MENPFPEPTRQSPAAILFLLGQVLRMLLRQLWVVVLVILFNPKKRALSGLTFFFLALGAFGAFSAIMRYLNYYFYLRDGHLVLDKGWLRKSRISVPLDCIQTVNFKQSALHQALNVVAVDIDTAGSVSQEFSLQAIRKDQAEALRNFVEQYAPAAPSQTTETIAGQDAPMTGQAGELVFRLLPGDLIKIGLSQNHLRTAGIIMAFFIGFVDDLAEALDIKLEKEIEQLTGPAGDNQFIALFAAGIVFFLFLSLALTLGRSVLRYFDLRLYRTARGLKMVSGLFTKQEVSARLSKIQYLRWTDNPLKRYFRMVSVRLPQAASVAMGRKATLSIPGCYRPQLQALTEICFPEEAAKQYDRHGVSARIIIRQLWWQAILPVAVLMFLTHNMVAWWLWLFWLPIGLYLSVRYHRNWRWEVSSESLRLRWGVITLRNVLLEWRHVQGVSIRQSWMLRRRGLAHVDLYTAAGPLRLPYLPYQKALALNDFVCFKVETDHRSWM